MQVSAAKIKFRNNDMIIFLHGPDDYRREQKKKFYIEEFKKKYSDLSLGRFDLAEEGAAENLESFLRSQSLFEKKKLAVIDNLYGADEKKTAEIFARLGYKTTVAKKATVGGGHDGGVILFSENKRPPKALAFLLEKPNLAEEFEYLEGAEWAAFVKKEAKNRGAALSADALNFLAEVYAKNSWGLVTEFEKLANLDVAESLRGPQEIVSKKGTIGKREASGGEGGRGVIISREDLEALGLEAAPNYWMVINSAKSRELKTRLWALEKLFAQKEPPAKIFNILASLWKEKIPAMAEYDFMAKSGKLEYEEALLGVIL